MSEFDRPCALCKQVRRLYRICDESVTPASDLVCKECIESPSIRELVENSEDGICPLCLANRLLTIPVRYLPDTREALHRFGLHMSAAELVRWIGDKAEIRVEGEALDLFGVSSPYQLMSKDKLVSCRLCTSLKSQADWWEVHTSTRLSRYITAGQDIPHVKQLTLQQVLAAAADLLEQKGIADAIDDRKGSPRSPFPLFVYEHTANAFGLKKLVDNSLKALMWGIQSHPTHARVQLISRLCGADALHLYTPLYSDVIVGMHRRVFGTRGIAEALKGDGAVRGPYVATRVCYRALHHMFQSDGVWNLAFVARDPDCEKISLPWPLDVQYTLYAHLRSCEEGVSAVPGGAVCLREATDTRVFEWDRFIDICGSVWWSEFIRCREDAAVLKIATAQLYDPVTRSERMRKRFVRATKRLAPFTGATAFHLPRFTQRELLTLTALMRTCVAPEKMEFGELHRAVPWAVPRTTHQLKRAWEKMVREFVAAEANRLQWHQLEWGDEWEWGALRCADSGTDVSNAATSNTNSEEEKMLEGLEVWGNEPSLSDPEAYALKYMHPSAELPEGFQLPTPPVPEGTNGSTGSVQTPRFRLNLCRSLADAAREALENQKGSGATALTNERAESSSDVYSLGSDDIDEAEVRTSGRGVMGHWTVPPLAPPPMHTMPALQHQHRLTSTTTSPKKPPARIGLHAQPFTPRAEESAKTFEESLKPSASLPTLTSPLTTLIPPRFVDTQELQGLIQPPAELFSTFHDGTQLVQLPSPVNARAEPLRVQSPPRRLASGRWSMPITPNNGLTSPIKRQPSQMLLQAYEEGKKGGAGSRVVHPTLERAYTVRALRPTASSVHLTSDMSIREGMAASSPRLSTRPGQLAAPLKRAVSLSDYSIGEAHAASVKSGLTRGCALVRVFAARPTAPMSPISGAQPPAGSTEGIDAALAAERGAVESLSLARCQLRQNFSTLAPVLAGMRHLTHLDVSENSLGVAGAIALGECIQGNPLPLQTLLIDNNGIGDEGARGLIQALTSSKACSTLTCVSISRNELGDGEPVAQLLLRCSHLSRLDISWNILEGNGGEFIAAALGRARALQQFHAQFNAFGDAVGAAIIRAASVELSDAAEWIPSLLKREVMKGQATAAALTAGMDGSMAMPLPSGQPTLSKLAKERLKRLREVIGGNGGMIGGSGVAEIDLSYTRASALTAQAAVQTLQESVQEPYSGPEFATEAILKAYDYNGLSFLDRRVALSQMHPDIRDFVERGKTGALLGVRRLHLCGNPLTDEGINGIRGVVATANELIERYCEGVADAVTAALTATHMKAEKEYKRRMKLCTDSDASPPRPVPPPTIALDAPKLMYVDMDGCAGRSKVIATRDWAQFPLATGGANGGSKKKKGGKKKKKGGKNK